MRTFLVQGGSATETDALPQALPATGFIWITTARAEFAARLADVQAALAALAGTQLVELHVRDLLNDQLPSHYDFTSQYDVLVFRRLAALGASRRGANGNGNGNGNGQGGTADGNSAVTLPPRLAARENGTDAAPSKPVHPESTQAALLREIDTSPVAFAVFDRVLLSVHPDDCAVRDAFALRLLTASPGEARAGPARLPASPADLMLRVVNLMVDGFLDLRRDLTRQLDHWQALLLAPRGRFNNWGTMLEARLALHELDQTCEDQRAAIQDWIDAIETWPKPESPEGRHERELLMVRSRDVLEHIERVVHHVRRLEQSAETTLQMHFSAQSNRTNDIMRVLTVLTAVFLPLNLIAGIFGMNFEFIPLLHTSDGFWIAMGAMAVIALVLVVFFWRKRYLERTGGS